jgi:C-5 cytosine-specific DNA methylase.
MNKVEMTANILFSGVGMQERGIENTGLFNLKVVSTSEIDKYAILSYAAIHHNLTLKSLNSEFERERERIEQNRDNMIQYLSDKKIGFDFTKIKCLTGGDVVQRNFISFTELAKLIIILEI